MTISSSMRDDLVRAILTYPSRKNFELPSLGHEMTSAFELNAQVLDAEPRDLEYKIRQDPGMTADIMRLANSPAYRRSNAPVNLRDVVIRLGRKEIYHVMMAARMRSLLNKSMTDVYHVFPRRWHDAYHHLVTCAFVTAWLADRQHWVSYDNGFISGMFHDIGKLIGLRIIADMVLRKEIDMGTFEPMFSELLDAVNQELGLHAMQVWKMPAYVIKVCELMSDLPAADRSIHQLAHGVNIISALDILHHSREFSDDCMNRVRISVDALQLAEATLVDIRHRFVFASEQASVLLGKGSR